MNKRFYWQAWPAIYRGLFWVLLAMFLLLVAGIIVLQVIGTEGLLGWDVLTQEGSYMVNFSNFALGPFNFSIAAEKFILTEIYSSGQMPDSSLSSQLLMAIISVCILLYLTLITFFKRFWYLVAMGGFLGFTILLHVESLQVFGWSGNIILAAIFILILTPSYYLHAFSSEAGFIKRLWVFSLSMIMIGVVIFFFSEANRPFQILINYGILAPYLIIIVFIVTVAHEIIAGFINIISATSGIANSTKLRHFLILSAIYLVNILFSYLYIAHYIDWQIFSINPFVILITSALLGVWGSRARATVYVGAAKLDIVWPLLYLVIAIVSMSTLIFFMVTLNDPILKVLGDIIIYTHLGIGVAFLLYVMYNFIPLIEKGFNIGKILYNPTNFPYLTYRLMAIIFVVALFSIRGFDYPTWYSMAGYNNAKGDLALSDKYFDVAEAYFTNSDAFAPNNHKANYTLGMMASATDMVKSAEYFTKALARQPSPQAAVAAAMQKNMEQDYYGGLFSLQEGAAIFKNDKVYNNLAVQFERLKLLDSANYYFGLTQGANHVVKDNQLAFAAKYQQSLGRDSVRLIKNLDRAGMANASALGVFSGRPEMVNANHLYDKVLLNNWLLSDLPAVEDQSLAWAKTVIDTTTNQEYREQLVLSWSLAAYRAGNMAEAIEGLLNVSFNSTGLSNKAQLALANMYLHMTAYEQAIATFLSINNGKLNLELATAYLENGDLEKSKPFWAEAQMAEDEYLRSIANEIVEALYKDNPALLTDTQKYIYARYNRYYIDESRENEILKTIESNDLRIGLALDLADFYHNLENDNGAKLMLANIGDLRLNLDQYRAYLIQTGLVAKDTERIQRLLNEFDSLYSFTADEYLIENILNYKAGMSLDSLDYIELARDNPFLVDAILIGVENLRTTDNSVAYNYLTSAVQQNPGSLILLKAYILRALDVGLYQFAENALYQFGQKFSGQAFLELKNQYDNKLAELNTISESEPME